jgi:HD-GYP domain-containing protein (c-di-GMP phosphodiesterase class II)
VHRAARAAGPELRPSIDAATRARENARVQGSTGGSDPRPGGASLRLADVLASLSLVADLGFGLPPEQSMRSSLVATALARHAGLPEREVADAFYTALLEHVGCIGFAHETSARYGDEMAVNAAAARTNMADPRDLFVTYLPAVTRGRGPLERVRVALLEVISGSRFGQAFVTATCEVGRATARRLGLSDGVQRGIHEVYESWNGSGGSMGLRGEAISLPARIVQVGATAALFDHIGGRDLALKVVRQQAGTILDPSLAALFASNAETLLAAVPADPHAALLELEPRPERSVPASRLVEVAAAFADLADLKSPFLLGHSSGVASLAHDAGRRLGLDALATGRLHVAAFLHDLGRVGISDSVWEQPGPLSASQWEQVRLHPYHSERILARSTALRPMAEIAGRHHERLDGSGYHRGSVARELPLPARILGAADAFQAMTQARPHRAALSADEAAAAVLDDVRTGLLDADAAAAVLEAAGQGTSRPRRPVPAGLSEREVEVLREVALGRTNREIAERFTISPRTAEHHVQHVYTKIGVSSRAAAAMFALEHDLLDLRE